MMNTQTHDFQVGPDELQGSFALNPINLGVRFVLEVFALVMLGAWGASFADGIMSIVLMIAFPVIGVSMWGIFNVPGDRSRSGGAPVPVPGIVRLMVEALIFGSATYGLVAVDRPTWALIFGVVVIVHYFVSYQRILWLVHR